MKILSVRRSGEHHVVIRVLGEGKPASYTVSSVTYSSLGSPPSGYTLSSEEISEIERDDEGVRAMKKALSLLAFSDVSEALLRLKLRRSGFSSDTASETVRECVNRGYLDEERQLERLIKKEADALRGPYFIKRKLISKGYSSSAVSKAMDVLVSSSEINFDEIFERLCEKVGATDDERYALLYKRGFKN